LPKACDLCPVSGYGNGSIELAVTALKRSVFVGRFSKRID